MNKTSLSFIVVVIAIIGALFLKSQNLIGANVKAIINNIPSWVTCYNDVEKAYSTVAPYRKYFCIDCKEYEVLTFDDEDECSTGWIGK